ncbi:MAG: DNA polymerase III subunit alpha, partial [Clostridia bacterium]
MTDFTHLHLHTEYSLLDGAVRISSSEFLAENPEEPKKVSPLCDALKKHGMDACAITDHGNMYGVYSFVTTLRKNKIKPIIGEEFYIADDMYAKTPDVLKQRYHLILLAKNQIGYQNLMTLSSLAFVDGFYMKPRIDLTRIREHSEGLICLSACLAGKVPHLLLEGNYEAAKAYAAEMRDIFAPGDFYIELQDHSLPEDKIVTNPLVAIAREIGVKVVATNDVHYIKREDADIQDTMMCITLQNKKNEINSMRFANDNFYLKTGDEMAEMFNWCSEAITSTREIVDKVEDFFVARTKEHFIPPYNGELSERIDKEMRGRNSEQYLHDIAWDGLRRRYGEITEEIKARIDHELDVINKCQFNDYFLIVWDYVHWAQEQGIPVGPGRGSGVGSIVAYSIGITDVDPLRFNLLFERFLSAERISMPDFDVDFCFMRRQEVVDYCINLYGKERVSQIIAYSTMSAKAVVKDVARVYDIPYAESASWVKDIPTGKVMLKQVMTKIVKDGEKSTDEEEVFGFNKFYSEEFLNTYNTNETAKKIIDTAMQLEGMPRQTSMHAAGVVICSKPVTECVALSRNGNDITTQFDKNVVEDIGLIKMDFLGLKTLTDISEAIRYIKEDKGINIDFHEIGYDDKNVFNLISTGDCVGVFQLESGGMSKFMSQLQPGSMEDVMAGIAMYRPGPMQFLNDFLEGKKHPESITYAHPLLKSILEITYGCIVYQEQVMQIAQKLAGYSFGCADILRKAISKKHSDVIKAQQKVFLEGGVLDGDTTHTHIPGALANGVSKEIVDELFKQILKFAKYAFNKSHAAAYAYLTYQTAYLKCYYPTYYLSAIINNRILNSDEIKHYMNYMRQRGIKFLPPDINKSQKYFSIDGENVRYGLIGIKGIGENAMEYILIERKNGAFKDVRDLISRCS